MSSGDATPAPLLRSGRAVRVCVTGAAGQIAYALLPSIARGDMLGADVRVTLQLLEIPVPAVMARLEGVAMELRDGAYELLDDVVVTSDAATAFAAADVAIFLGAFPRKKGMLRKDLLEENAAIFKQQGAALDAHASRGVKVVVVGNPANTNCLTLRRCAPRVPASNFSALTRLDANRATAALAARLGVCVGRVRNIVVWGNHSATQVPDASSLAVVEHWPQRGVASSARAAVGDDAWLHGAFADGVRQRGAAVIAKRGMSSAASAARAVVEHMRSWLCGTAPGEVVSMAVVVEDDATLDAYGIPRNTVFSLPVTCAGGQWRAVQGVRLDQWTRDAIAVSARELVDERDAAAQFLGLAKL